MDDNLNTVDSILETFERWSREKQPIDAHVWLDGCSKLTVLLGDEQNALYLLQQKIAQKRLEFVESGDSVAKAKLKMETTDEYVQSRMLEAKIDRVTELIRISKLQARMSDDNQRNYR
mgnify:CR=1 FL=1